eukprot:2343548-Pyramimonas_sp.AAC.2
MAHSTTQTANAGQCSGPCYKNQPNDSVTTVSSRHWQRVQALPDADDIICAAVDGRVKEVTSGLLEGGQHQDRVLQRATSCVHKPHNPGGLKQTRPFAFYASRRGEHTDSCSFRVQTLRERETPTYVAFLWNLSEGIRLA